MPAERGLSTMITASRQVVELALDFTMQRGIASTAQRDELRKHCIVLVAGDRAMPWPARFTDATVGAAR